MAQSSNAGSPYQQMPAQPLPPAHAYEPPRKDYDDDTGSSCYKSGVHDLTSDERKGLITKVYGVTTVMLLVGFGLSLLASLASQNNWYALEAFFKSWVTLVVSVVLLIVSGISVFCCYRKVPTNYIMAFVFAASLGVLIASIAAFVDPWTVLLAMGITVLITISVTVLTMVCSEFVILAFIVMLLVEVILIFFLTAFWFSPMHYGEQRWLLSGILALYAIVYACYISYDAYVISTGLGPDDYIVGAVILYVHVMYLFLYILMLLGSSRN